MLCGTDNIMQNIPHIQIGYGEYYVGLTIFYIILSVP
jgi:hypothetical protein